MGSQPAKVLTIGGSDSGGAAGIQADLKTWTALGAYGMSVVTAVTAQNSIEVTGVHYMTPDFVTAQLDAVLSDYGAQAVKTGFIGQSSLIKAAASELKQHDSFHLVVDPVLVNHRGQTMFPQEVVDAYRDHLIPQAALITPNWQEAAILAGLPRKDRPVSVEELAAALHELGAKNLLITGQVTGEQIIDTWSDGKQITHLASPLIVTENVHGSGDTLSAAICAFLAQGQSIADAITHGREFTSKAVQAAAGWHLGQGHGPLSHFPS